MEYGRTDLRVQAAGLEHDARIRTPGATASVRGTALSVYDQPPFSPELKTYTGLVDYRYAKRQMSVGKGGRSAGGHGAAETALLSSVVDPADANARTNADAALISQEVSRGAVLTYDPDFRINEIRGGAGAQTDLALQNSLPGRLNFVVRWGNDVDVDLYVTVQPGDQLNTILTGSFNPKTVLYPGFGLETSALGGRVPYNHRGGPAGGQEICFWVGSFPTAVYGFSAINNDTQDTANVRFNAYLDGEKISLFGFDPVAGLVRSKGFRRDVPPVGSASTIVLAPPHPLFEDPLVIPESPDETLDGTVPGAAPDPVPTDPPAGEQKLASVKAGKQKAGSQASARAAKAPRGKLTVADRKLARENRVAARQKPVGLRAAGKLAVVARKR
jgi:hypothetical protein